MHEHIQAAIEANTRASKALLDLLTLKIGAATSEELAAVYHKLKDTDLPAMENRLLTAINATISGPLEAAASRLQEQINLLDAQVPDKSEPA